MRLVETIIAGALTAWLALSVPGPTGGGLPLVGGDGPAAPGYPVVMGADD